METALMILGGVLFCSIIGYANEFIKYKIDCYFSKDIINQDDLDGSN